LYFEYSVSVDDDTAIVGTYRDDTPSRIWAGSVFVFTRINNSWSQQERLFAPDPADDYSFGWSVSISNDTVLIGAPVENSPGYTYVFTRTGNSWTQQAKLLASDGAAWDMFGLSVSLDGDTALIGAPSDDDNGNFSGSAYVFTRTGSTWTQQAKLLASDGREADLFGASVSLDGDTALIGAPADGVTSTSSGCVYVFTRSGATWTQQAKIIASDCIRKDQFGISVSLDGDTALIGAQQLESYWGTGRAYIYTRSGSIWTQQAKLLASDGEIGDSFGYSVSISNDTALIGAHWDDHGGGSAYVFTRTGSTWTQQQKLQVSDKLGARFGISVALDGDTALIASFFDGDVERFGSAYIFIRTGTIWTEEKQLLTSPTRIDIILIACITDKYKLDTNSYSFTVQLGYVLEFITGKYMPYPDSTPMIDYPFEFAYHSMRGYFGTHFICAMFFDCNFPYTS
jgi:hypothetical protein